MLKISIKSKNRLSAILLWIMVLSMLPETFIAQECNDELKSGEGTYYTGVDGGEEGNCNLLVQQGDVYHAALNTIDYNGSDACGACIEIMGPKGVVKVKVVDRCPECKEGDVDMTEEAFAQMAEVIDGRVPIRWKFVPCFAPDAPETIKVYFNIDSQMYWTAVQFRNINHSIKEVSYLSENGEWIKMQRELYNYFVKDGGIPSPMDLKITSIFDEEIIFEEVAMQPGKEIETTKQFSTPSECLNVLSTEEYLSENIHIYPNPTEGIVYLTQNYLQQWMVRDVTGKLVQKGSGSVVDLSALNNGIFWLQINNKHYYRLLKK